MNILYIEDEPNDAALVDLYIKSTPHQLAIATNTTEARAYQPQMLDLILVDVLLGTTRDGLSLAGEFRRRGYGGPMVAITALATPKDQEECRRAGFDAILNKPYTINDLAHLIEQYAN